MTLGMSISTEYVYNTGKIQLCSDWVEQHWLYFMQNSDLAASALESQFSFKYFTWIIEAAMCRV